MKFIHIGYRNLVAAERIVALAAPDSAPIRRLIQDSREQGRAIDCTCGKKTKSVLITDSDHILLSALPPETLAARMGEGAEAEADETGIEEAE